VSSLQLDPGTAQPTEHRGIESGAEFGVGLPHPATRREAARGVDDGVAAIATQHGRHKRVHAGHLLPVHAVDVEVAGVVELQESKAPVDNPDGLAVEQLDHQARPPDALTRKFGNAPDPIVLAKPGEIGFGQAAWGTVRGQQQHARRQTQGMSPIREGVQDGRAGPTVSPASSRCGLRSRNVGTSRQRRRLGPERPAPRSFCT
jgi:hypothetical protein